MSKILANVFGFLACMVLAVLFIKYIAVPIIQNVTPVIQSVIQTAAPAPAETGTDMNVGVPERRQNLLLVLADAVDEIGSLERRLALREGTIELMQVRIENLADLASSVRGAPATENRSSPWEAVQIFFNASAAGDVETVYNFHDAAFRECVPISEFARSFEPIRIKGIAFLTQAIAEDASYAYVTYTFGTLYQTVVDIRVISEDGRWVLPSSPDMVCGSSPAEKSVSPQRYS